MKGCVVVILVTLLTSAPAPADVDISCAQVEVCGPNVIVSFCNTVVTPVRAFALDISVSEGNIVAVECLTAGYYIYPGSIEISGGQVTDWGSCLCTVLPANSVTIEMASLYQKGVESAPPQCGDLVKITVGPPLVSPLCATVDAFASDPTVIVTENGLRGGVVMEDPALAAVVNLCTWVLECWGPCNCRDYPTQCHGDTDNSGDIKGSDFLALKNSWYKVYPDVVYNPCADFDRNGAVKGSDFLILKNNWYKTVPGDCPPGDINCIYCR